MPMAIEYPTRLLGVRQPRTVQLVLTKTIPGRNRYVTLSHCWGETPIFTHTKKTAKKLLAGISEDELPKTFREAVVATRRLCVDYLWIDSLCIVQDDLSDWEKESALIAGIYGGSFCNLAATSSSDPSEGLFRGQSDRSVADPRPVEITTRFDFFGEPLVRPEYKQIAVVWSSLWKEEIESQPLLKRAWVVQERALAPRTIHFARYQVFWECSMLAACEAFPHGPVGREVRMQLPYPVQERQWYGLTKSKDVPVTVALSSWREIVVFYSKCGLTVRTDKLTAISGLAKRMQPVIGCRYLAGLWEKHFLQQLLWWGGSRDPRSPKLYIAPSWSWASVEGEIGFINGATDSIHEFTNSSPRLLGVEVRATSDDPMLSVKSGYIRLEAPLAYPAKGILAERIYNVFHSAIYDDKFPIVPFQTKSGWHVGLILKAAESSKCEFERIGWIYYPGLSLSIYSDCPPDLVTEWNRLMLGEIELEPMFRCYESKTSVYCEELGGTQTLYTFKIV